MDLNTISAKSKRKSEDDFLFIKQRLIDERITSYTDVKKRLRTVELFVFTYRNSSEESKLIKNITEKEIFMTQQAYEAGEVFLEGSLRDFILRKSSLSLTEIIEILKKAPPVRRTFKYAGKEADSAKINNKSVVVHVGMGSLPETLLGILDNKINDLPKLCGIDMDRIATSEARELIKSMHLENKISLIHKNGSAFNYEKFSHILVAVLVRPEYETIIQICKTASKNHRVTVLLRTVKGLGAIIYKPAEKKSIDILEANDFKLIDVVRGHVVMETLVFQREPQVKVVNK